MVKFLRQSLISPELKKLYGQTLGDKIKFFWNKGWNEIPEIMITLPFGIIGIATIVYVAIKSSNDTTEPTFRNKIVIYRPNDPRIQTIPEKTNYKLDYPSIW